MGEVEVMMNINRMQVKRERKVWRSYFVCFLLCKRPF